ncbi:MAG: symmetrical bis(5'-nucleosyl)-tetraphosphatase [Francisellaceae bacterium]
MSCYIIGDVQGCYDTLERLLSKIEFNRAKDRLIFAGDIISRGDRSLETIRFIRSLGSVAGMVLGNHDLSAISAVYGFITPDPKDYLDDLLNATDRFELIEWLKSQPFLLQYKHITIVHAGIHPQWSTDQAKAYADELQTVIQSSAQNHYFRHLFGAEPHCWDERLCDIERWRCLTNYFTRMRICDDRGCLNFSFKGEIKDIPCGFKPWFSFVNSNLKPQEKIVFGHWAALNGKLDDSQFIGLDTGCVWGGKLTAFNPDSGHFFQVNRHHNSPS